MPKGHKKPKDSTYGAPKKNQSSYFIFSNERRSILSKENSSSSVTDISKIISAEWKEMDAETKKKYQDRAVEQKQEWLKQYDVFKQTDGYKKYMAALTEWKENEKNMGRSKGGKSTKKNKKAPKKPKQPEAMPKRPQSSYFIFSNERRNEMKDQYPDKKITELSKLIAEEWKGKSAEAKKVYEDQAQINKKKYHETMEEYKKTEEYKSYQNELDQWKKDKKRFENEMDVDSDDDTPKISMPRKPKDDKCPKRPLTSYFLYAKAVREETKTEFPNKPITEIATEISKKWKLLSEEEKKPYNDEAARLKEQYKKDMEEYQGSDAQKEFKRKLEEWKEECDKRRREAKEKQEKKKLREAAKHKKKVSPKHKKKVQRMEESSDDESDSSSDSDSSDDSSGSDSDSDSSSDSSDSSSSSD